MLGDYVWHFRYQKLSFRVCNSFYPKKANMKHLYKAMTKIVIKHFAQIR